MLRIARLRLTVSARYESNGRTTAFDAGVEAHELEGVPVRITCPAKTVADCFKFRNKIGLDVALEALRDYRGARRDLEELRRFAKVCRVERVMRPYLEAILAGA